MADLEGDRPRHLIPGPRRAQGLACADIGRGMIRRVSSPEPDSGGRSRATGRMVARPDLYRLLSEAVRVTTVSAPAGSGKTMLLRSWIDESGLADRAAWVAAETGGRDPQTFWLAVAGALGRTPAGARLVRPVSAAPDTDGWALVERLLAGLAPLRETLWLVVDDVHELEPAAVRQLELLVLRAPASMRFVLASRHDVRLGLHRLRLEGELTEIRAADLRFSRQEAQELFAAAGVPVPDSALALLHERTEGWAAGLRMAALSLAGHPDPERFASEFSGSERTVAEYLVVEVLERLSPRTRRLLLRTSILEWVTGESADLLAGGSDGERMLQDLERAGAFVMSLDSARTRFRYHSMFAGLLALELRRTLSGEVTELHRIASGWFAENGHPVEAVRHAQAAREWELAVRLLVSCWPSLYLDGQEAAVRALLAGFPDEMCAADAELSALAAADELAHGSLKATERQLARGERAMESAPADRRGRADLLLGIVRLLTARQRGDLAAETREAQRLKAAAESPQAVHAALSEELRALALISLGYANSWTSGSEQARHLEEGVALARRTGRPYLEFTGLAYQSAIEAARLLPGAQANAVQALDLAEQHGWTDKTAVGVATVALAGALVRQGRLDEAEARLQHAALTIGPEIEAVASLAALFIRAQLELARGRTGEALAALRSAEALAGVLTAPHPFARPVRAWLLRALVRLGEIETAQRALAEIGGRERDSGLIRVTAAILRLAQDDPRGALTELAPVVADTAHPGRRAWLVEAFLLDAIARDALGEKSAADHALGCALEYAEADDALLWFMLHPVSELLERYARRASGRSDLAEEIRLLLSGRIASPVSSAPEASWEALSESELRVLRYLPTNLTAPEIGDELSVSRNTVKTHMRSLYAKLDTHTRAETVGRARELGLLAPSGLPR